MPIPLDELKALTRCIYCAGYHLSACPYIEEIEYYPEGKGIRRIKFFPRPELIEEIMTDLEEELAKHGAEGSAA